MTEASKKNKCANPFLCHHCDSQHLDASAVPEFSAMADQAEPEKSFNVWLGGSRRKDMDGVFSFWYSISSMLLYLQEPWFWSWNTFFFLRRCSWKQHVAWIIATNPLSNQTLRLLISKGNYFIGLPGPNLESNDFAKHCWNGINIKINHEPLEH